MQSFAGWNQTNNILDLGQKMTKTMPKLSGCLTAEQLAHFEAQLNESWISNCENIEPLNVFWENFENFAETINTLKYIRNLKLN